VPQTIDLTADKLVALEERMRAMERTDLYYLVKATGMCLTPNMVFPKKSRVTESVKYTSTQFPMTHFKTYYNKMTKIVYNEKLLIHFFQDILSATALS
jgi:hypothetical protein